MEGLSLVGVRGFVVACLEEGWNHVDTGCVTLRLVEFGRASHCAPPRRNTRCAALLTMQIFTRSEKYARFHS